MLQKETKRISEKVLEEAQKRYLERLSRRKAGRSIGNCKRRTTDYPYVELVY